MTTPITGQSDPNYPRFEELPKVDQDLYLAIYDLRKGSLEKIRDAIERNANIEAQFYRKCEDGTYMAMGSPLNDISKVKCLADKMHTAMGSPLNAACFTNDISKVKCLLDAGAKAQLQLPEKRFYEFMNHRDPAIKKLVKMMDQNEVNQNLNYA